MLRSRLFLLLILAAAFLFRVQTLHWNFFIHADTEFDTEATASLVHYGKLLVFPEKLTIVPTNEPLPPLEQGEILTQHGPLWPILGATVMRIFGWAPTMANAFLSLRILSLLSGLAIIALSYFITRKLIHEYAALACASFLTFSYVMADYSGNGSMYSLQTALYLLWIWSAMNHALRFRVAYLGIITGLSYLLNFQSIILIPATIILLLLEPISWRKKIPSLTLALILALVVVSPWLIRNAILFGDPLYSHVINQIYVLNKAGYQPTVENGLYRFHLTFWDYFSVIIGILQVWLPNNLYYAARKLFILAPIAFFFFSYGLPSTATSSIRSTCSIKQGTNPPSRMGSTGFISHSGTISRSSLAFYKCGCQIIYITPLANSSSSPWGSPSGRTTRQTSSPSAASMPSASSEPPS
jgi:4-amino-4-deoxy-L-arabinose transferase-like glycosyltransferase